MVNPIFLKTAEKWMNAKVPQDRERAREQEQEPQTPTIPTNTSNTSFPDLPSESLIFSYDGQHGDYFQELIAKSNEIFSGTKAEIPAGTSGEVTNMYSVKRMVLISTIAKNPNLRNYNLMPITATQSEFLLKEGKLTNPQSNWEDLGLVLYDASSEGRNPKEAQALKESIVNHRTQLGLIQEDLEKRLVIVNAGGEVDSSMPHGIKPIIVPGITQVYQHEVLEKVGENPSFDGYGLNGGLPLLNQLGNGDRTLYMPSDNSNIGLRVLYRGRGLDLFAGVDGLSYSYVVGRVNFAPQGLAKNK